MRKTITLKFWASTILMLIVVMSNAQTFKSGTFRYKVIGNNAVEVSSADSSMSGNVAIPATTMYNNTNYNVTAIAAGGFSGCTGIRSIILPSKISKIGKDAFLNCWNLNSVNIPYAVKKIEDGTFCYCKSLAGITIPDGVTSIGNYAFAHCENITRFNVPDNCKSIGNKAFYGCKKLQAVAIPAALEKIGVRMLQGCVELRRVSVEPENNFFATVDDVFYDKSLSRLIKYPAYKDNAMFEMPSSVKNIDEYAFENVGKLLVVKIAAGCTRISNMAFVNCENLQRADYPAALQEVGMDSFFGCMRLKESNMPACIFIEYDAAIGLVDKYE